MKKTLILSFFILSFCILKPYSILAQDKEMPVLIEKDSRFSEKEMTNETEIQINGGKINFASVGARGCFYNQIVQPKEIYISENEAGTLKYGTKLYIEVDKLEFCNYVKAIVVEGDLKIGYIINEGILEISFIEESTLPSKIKIFLLAVNMDEYAFTPTLEHEKFAYSFPLKLKTGALLADNLLSNIQEDIIINDNFIVQQELHIEAYRSAFEGRRIIASKNTVTINNVSYGLNNSCYIKDGYFMVPAREMFQIIYDLDLQWDKDLNEAYSDKWFKMPANTSSITIYEKEYLLCTETEIMNDALYISFRDLMQIITANDPYNKFYWDDVKQLVVYNMVY